MSDGGSGSMSDAGDITLPLKCTITGSSVVAGGQEVATELEEAVDLAVAEEEPLGMPHRFEALLLLFSPSCRLVRELRLVVGIAALPVLDPG